MKQIEVPFKNHRCALTRYDVNWHSKREPIANSLTEEMEA